MKVTIELEKYSEKQTKNDYISIDKMGCVWIVHEQDGVKHSRLMTPFEWEDWGIVNIEK